jgi:hypothetical protein
MAMLGQPKPRKTSSEQISLMTMSAVGGYPKGITVLAAIWRRFAINDQGLWVVRLPYCVPLLELANMLHKVIPALDKLPHLIAEISTPIFGNTEGLQHDRIFGLIVQSALGNPTLE